MLKQFRKYTNIVDTFQLLMVGNGTVDQVHSLLKEDPTLLVTKSSVRNEDGNIMRQPTHKIHAGWLPVHYAARSGNIKTVEILLNARTKDLHFDIDVTAPILGQFGFKYLTINLW